MIYIYGDSHAEFNFKNFALKHINLREYSVTMHRVGRDKQIIGFNNSHNGKDNIFIFCYGEVDCRCHIGKQIVLGRNEDDIINELVIEYINAIKSNIKEFKKILICSITPTQNKEKFENIHGPIKHQFPFVGTNSERAKYTYKMNQLLKNECTINGFVFFDVYDYYTDDNGLLKWELSDEICHIKDNSYILQKLNDIITNTF